ncbi:MAG: HAD-IIA family hydrolase [Clostridia bacterium]|nr:HAD-IIA family hydrolase [Clostridia bacterium]
MDLLREKKLFVMDMDGTIYLGDKVIKGAPEFIQRVRDNNAKVMYFTNNASKNPDLYLEKLHRLGFTAHREEIVTSGDVTVGFLNKHRAGKTVYLMGTPALHETFEKAGIHPVKEGEPADIVVVSFDTTLTYEKLDNACALIRNGAEFLSTHPDINCPIENGFMPDSGAICALVTLSTGVEPRYFGKPNAETAEYIEDYSGIARKDTVMIGDRLYTDIATGKKHGITAAFVLSGEGTMEDVEKLDDSMKPDIIFGSVDDIR